MKDYTLLRKGFSHPVYCEDFLLNVSISNWKLIAVFDGCSSGEDSHFASSLYAKIVRKAFLDSEKKFFTPEDYLKSVIRDLVVNLLHFQKELNLSVLELLSTAIIAILDTNSNCLESVVIGDGVLVCDNKIIEVDQGNKPNYLIYEAENLMQADVFSEWWKTHKQRFHFPKFKDFSISTDGILSYTKGALGKEIKSREIIENLLVSEEFSKSNAMLGRKHNLLQKRRKIMNFDDIAVIRILNYD